MYKVHSDNLKYVAKAMKPIAKSDKLDWPVTFDFNGNRGSIEVMVDKYAARFGFVAIADGDEPMRCAISSKAFAKYAEVFDDYVTMEVDGENMVWSDGGGKKRIKIKLVESVVDGIDFACKVVERCDFINGKSLHDTMKRAVKYTGNDGIHTAISKVCFNIDHIAATDSYRIIRESVNCINTFSNEFTIGGDIIGFAMPLMKDSKFTSFYSDDEHEFIELTTGTVDTVIMARTEQVSFPNYMKMFDGFDFEDIIAIDGDSLNKCASFLWKLNDKNSVIRLNTGTGIAVCGDGDYDLEFKGFPIEIGFNLRYFKEAVECMDDIVSFKFKSPTKPVIFDDGTHEVLLMPVRLV